MSVHQQRVGWRRITTRRRIPPSSPSTTNASVPVMRVMWTGQINESWRGGRAGGGPRLAAKRLSRGEAAGTAEKAVRVAHLGVTATM